MERKAPWNFQGKIDHQMVVHSSNGDSGAPGWPFPQMAGRLEDARLLRGRGRYIDDLPVAPNALHAAVLRSPHAHARIRKIDTRAAVTVPGVFAVYNGQDIAAVLDPFPSIVRNAPLYRAVTLDKVRYVGEPVAVVLAHDRYTAEDGLAAVDVDYEPFEVVTRLDAACAAGAPLLHEEQQSNIIWRQHYRYGDPEHAFAEAERIVRVALTFPKYNSTPLETYGVVAEYLPEHDGFVINGNFQGPFSLLPVMARALRVPESSVACGGAARHRWKLRHQGDDLSLYGADGGLCTPVGTSG